MGDPLVVVTGVTMGPTKSVAIRFFSSLSILIPRHDQQTVVPLSPLDVGLQVVPEPRSPACIASGSFPWCMSLTWFGTTMLTAGSAL